MTYPISQHTLQPGHKSWGGKYLLCHDLGPGLCSLLCNEVGVQLEHVFHHQGHFSFSIFIGCDSNLLCLVEVGCILTLLCNLYILTFFFKLCLALLLFFQQTLVGLLEAILPNGRMACCMCIMNCSGVLLVQMETCSNTLCGSKSLIAEGICLDSLLDFILLRNVEKYQLATANL